MLAGPKRAVSGPNEPPRLDRVIADSWRGLYGSDPFPSMLPGAAFEILRNGAICAEYINIRGVFPCEKDRLAGGHLDPAPADIIEDIIEL